MSKEEVWLFIPDVHIPHQDDAALDAVVELIEDLQPHGIVQLGDLMDCYSISDYDRDPKRLLSFQEELDGAAAFWARIRRSAPQARLIFRYGNHEARLRKLLWKVPSLAGLTDLTIAKLCRLAEHGVEWFEYGDRLVLHDSLMVCHGQAIRSQAGMSGHAELMQRQMSGVSGHTHRAGITHITNESGTRFWVECGHMANHDAAHYLGDVKPNWQQAVACWDGDEWWPYLIPVRQGVLRWGGRFYGGR